jgi:hypothetical protein
MRGQYDSVRHGMSVYEVEGILGKPNFHDSAEQKVWTSEWGIITVGFKNGRVNEKEFTPIILHPVRRVRSPLIPSPVPLS